MPTAKAEVAKAIARIRAVPMWKAKSGLTQRQISTRQNMFNKANKFVSDIYAYGYITRPLTAAERRQIAGMASKAIEYRAAVSNRYGTSKYGSHP